METLHAKPIWIGHERKNPRPMMG